MLVVGCSESDNSTSPSSADAAHPSALVGTWKNVSTDAGSTTTQTLTLAQDGSFTSLSVIASSSTTDQFPGQGSWSVSGDTLKMGQGGAASARRSIFTVSSTRLFLSAIGDVDTTTFLRQ